MIRRSFLSGAGLLALSRLARAQITTTGAGSFGYSGPGDILAAAGAYMLRGYSQATADAAQCVRLRRSSDDTEQDFGLGGGNLNQTAISVFGGVSATGTGSISGTTLTFTGGVLGGQVTGAGVLPGTLIIGGSSPTWTVNLSQTVASTAMSVANALCVTRIYDQTGNLAPVVQTTKDDQPYLALNAKNARPAMFLTGNGMFLATAANIADIPQPLSYSYVFEHVGNVTPFGTTVGNNTGGSNARSGTWNTPDTVFIFSSAGGTASALDGVWHSIQCMFNGASSIIYVDGAPTTADGGADGYVSAEFAIGNDGFGNFLTGFMADAVVFGVDITAPQAAALTANQKSYYGL